ncbi:MULTISPECIES: hypothetical protein [Pseudomonas]|uniref:DUF4345 domain-containing protein n=1 Tax=Pseudomonas frederiksbergensis TaxID=104087 RepID=A0A6L5C207_9PSED|nr:MULTISPECIES: hypothetical protein [Pseudomonas]KAA8554005.1 hypothetical protein FX984_00616 [Pseudomonas marginalis]KAF2394849.1 hypothetical protein FX983_02831 [Pseudomonas frederiksbergensis]
MQINFRSLAILSAFLFFALAFTWMFAPNILLASWGVDFSDSVGLVGRRGAALYAGIGVMFFSARNAGPSLARSSLIAGFVVTCLILAVLGVFELAMGHAGFRILSAVLIEVALIFAFLYVSRASKSDLQTGSTIR